MGEIEIGRMLRASTTEFVFGCRTKQETHYQLGSLVRVELNPRFSVFGMIVNIHIDDDGLVRQLVTAENMDEAIIRDNRENRNIPLELSALSLGFIEQQQVFHLLPPRPPMALDPVYKCTDEEVIRFTSAGHFGYLRHILRQKDLPVDELIAAHLNLVNRIQSAAGDEEWLEKVIHEVITLLRDDYPTLISVLNAMRDIELNPPAEGRSIHGR